VSVTDRVLYNSYYHWPP